MCVRVSVCVWESACVSTCVCESLCVYTTPSSCSPKTSEGVLCWTPLRRLSTDWVGCLIRHLTPLISRHSKGWIVKPFPRPFRYTPLWWPTVGQRWGSVGHFSLGSVSLLLSSYSGYVVHYCFPFYLQILITTIVYIVTDGILPRNYGQSIFLFFSKVRG